jgi:hypothetical protein
MILAMPSWLNNVAGWVVPPAFFLFHAAKIGFFNRHFQYLKIILQCCAGCPGSDGNRWILRRGAFNLNRNKIAVPIPIKHE